MTILFRPNTTQTQKDNSNHQETADFLSNYKELILDACFLVCLIVMILLAAKRGSLNTTPDIDNLLPCPGGSTMY